MPDAKPPRLAGNERATVGALLQYHRDSFVRKVSGVSDEDARMSPVGSGTSLLSLANHLADAETLWILQRFAQIDDAGEPPAETIRDAIDRYQRTWARVDAVIKATPSLLVECPDFDGGPPTNLRWIVDHLLEETARHAGHADILRELIDGTTGR
jgi:hypothetical protein